MQQPSPGFTSPPVYGGAGFGGHTTPRGGHFSPSRTHTPRGAPSPDASEPWRKFISPSSTELFAAADKQRAATPQDAAALMKRHEAARSGDQPPLGQPPKPWSPSQGAHHSEAWHKPQSPATGQHAHTFSAASPSIQTSRDTFKFSDPNQHGFAAGYGGSYSKDSAEVRYSSPTRRSETLGQVIYTNQPTAQLDYYAAADLNRDGIPDSLQGRALSGGSGGPSPPRVSSSQVPSGHSNRSPSQSQVQLSVRLSQFVLSVWLLDR